MRSSRSVPDGGGATAAATHSRELSRLRAREHWPDHMRPQTRYGATGAEVDETHSAMANALAPEHHLSRLCWLPLFGGLPWRFDTTISVTVVPHCSSMTTFLPSSRISTRVCWPLGLLPSNSYQTLVPA